MKIVPFVDKSWKVFNLLPRSKKCPALTGKCKVFHKTPTNSFIITLSYFLRIHLYTSSIVVPELFLSSILEKRLFAVNLMTNVSSAEISRGVDSVGREMVVL